MIAFDGIGNGIPCPGGNVPEVLVFRSNIIRRLRDEVISEKCSLNAVKRIVKEIIETEAWREFYLPDREAIYRHENFLDFISGPKPGGLELEPSSLRSLIRDDIVLLDLWDRAVQRPGVNEYGCKGKPEENGVDNVHDIQEERPTGNTSSAALRRLRKDRPDLHARVLDGELSPHAAAVKAGFRPKTYTIPHDPERVARKLVSVFSDQELMLIGNLIAEMKGATS